MSLERYVLDFFEEGTTLDRFLMDWNQIHFIMLLLILLVLDQMLLDLLLRNQMHFHTIHQPIQYF